MGGAFDFEDTLASLLDIEGAVIATHGAVFGGVSWRMLDLEFEELIDSVDVELSLGGPQAFVGFEW